MRLVHRLDNRDGFSIAEMLVAILILLMVSSVVAGGIPVARDAYNKVTVSANAQVVLSTAISALRNELAVASDVEIEGTSVSFTNPDTGGKTTISCDSDDIKIQDTISIGIVTGKPSDKRLLVTLASAGNDKLHVTYESVGTSDSITNNGIITFTNLQVKREGDTTARVKLDSLSVRIISAS